MTIPTRIFGRHDGRDVVEATLTDGAVSVAVISYGAVIRDWRVAVAGESLPMVLGFDRFEDYPAHSRFFGAVPGRVANRIAGGRFTLDGATYQLARNNGPNHLHGGETGLGRRVWDLETDAGANAVRLSYHSPDGEEGYPGAVDFTVTYRLAGARLRCEMAGVPDRRTPINLAQHSYFNLAGSGDVLDHELRIAADRHTPVGEAPAAGPGRAADSTLIPTGEIAPVAGTRFDFRHWRGFRGPDGAGVGYDNNLIFADGLDRSAPVAEARCGRAGPGLRLWTDQPAVQLFNAPTFEIGAPGLGGRRYGHFCGFCLEAQHFPDSVNQPNFPSVIRSPENPYRQVWEVEIG